MAICHVGSDLSGMWCIGLPGLLSLYLPLRCSIAAVNFLQRWSWIPRRDACGTPCQSCRHRCEYQAISPVGKINYSECFQCLDCVSIYQDQERCLPLIQERKLKRKNDKRFIPIYVSGDL